MEETKSIVEHWKPSQGVNECTALVERIRPIAPKVIVEIGVHLAHSIMVWNDCFNPDLIIGIDNEFQEEANDNFAKIGEAGHYLSPYDSAGNDALDKVVILLAGRKIDFLFIDGDHRYPAAKRDFDLYKHFVRPGGFIAIHDVTLEGEQWINLVETKRLFEEIEGKKELIHLDGTGTGLIHV